MIGGGFSSLAAQIAATNEFLRVFASTDFSAPSATADLDGPRSPPAAPSPEARGVGLGSATAVDLPPVDRMLAGDGPREDPTRSLAGLRPPAFAATGVPVADEPGGEPADGQGSPAGTPPHSAQPAATSDERAPRDGAPVGIAVPAAAPSTVDGPVPMPRSSSPGTDQPEPDGPRPGAGPVETATAAPEPRPAVRPNVFGASSDAPWPAPVAARGSPAIVPASSGPGEAPMAAQGAPAAPPPDAALTPSEAVLPHPGAEGSPRRTEDSDRPAGVAASADDARGPDLARAVVDAGPALPVILHDAVAGLDLRFASEGANAGGASADGMAAAIAAATVVFNAAMIPGWPPPRPFNVPGPEDMLARMLSRCDTPEGEAALVGDLASRCGAPGVGVALQALLRRSSRARRLRALFGLAALMDTIEAVIEAVEAELLDLSRARRDGEDDWDEAGARRQLTA